MQVSLLRRQAMKCKPMLWWSPVLQDRREDRLGLGALYDAGEITGKPFEIALLHNVPGMRAKRVLAVGRGQAREVHRGGIAEGGRRGHSASEIEVHHGSRNMAGHRARRRRLPVRRGGRRYPWRFRNGSLQDG